MRFDVLINFIVPLTFLAIWALTAILNRDAQPLPPRTGRPPGPGGMQPGGRLPGQVEPLRPGGGLSNRPAALPGSGERAAAWNGLGSPPAPPPAPRPRPRVNTLEEAIVYLENEQGAQASNRPAMGQPGTAGGRPLRGSSRRGGRSRTGVSGPNLQGRAEPETRRALTDQVSQALAKQKSKPLELSPLSAPMAALSSPLSRPSTISQTSLFVTPDSTVTPPLGAAEIQKMLATPTKLREVFMLIEILRPPVALRHQRRQ
ncbi:MAG: hypothetical protein ACP5XB_17430 [Isosphaeraceae bacterium]